MVPVYSTEFNTEGDVFCAFQFSLNKKEVDTLFYCYTLMIMMLESLHKVLPKFHCFLSMLLHLLESWMVQTCENGRQVSRCSAVSSELPHLHKASQVN